MDGFRWWCAVAAALFAANGVAASGDIVQVVVVDLPNWITHIIAEDDGTNPSNNIIPVSDCTSGSFGAIRLPPGGSAIARHIGPLCALAGGAGVYPVENPGSIESQLVFTEPESGAQSTLIVPALSDPLMARGDTARISRISNGNGQQTYLVVFGDPGPLTLHVLNGEQQQVGIEFVDAPQFLHPFAVLFYPLQTPVDIGSIVVIEGDTRTPSRVIPNRTYHGFATVAGPDGRTQVIRTWNRPPEEPEASADR